MSPKTPSKKPPRQPFQKHFCLSNFRKGFTLIEIMIALSIAGIIASIGLVSYRDYLRRQAVIQTSKQLKTALRQVQQKAMAGEKTTVCDGVDNILGNFDDLKLEGWFLSVNTSTKTYTTYGRCGGQQFDTSPAIPLTGTETVTITNGQNPIQFYPLSRSPGGTGDTVYTLSGNGQTSTVTVSLQGTIQ